MANKQRDLAKERWWRDRFKRHSASGLSVRAFCRRERLSEASFHAWRRTIAQRDTANRRKRALRVSRPATFVPMTVIEPAPREASFTIELAGGRALRLPATIAPLRLAEVVQAIEGLAVMPGGQT